MAVYQNHRGLFLGLGLWVLCVFLLGYTTTANSTDENGSPVVEYMTDDERKDLFERGIKPKKLKLVNRETKPVVTKEEPSDLKTVKSCQNAVISILKEQPIEFLPERHTLSRTSIETVKDISVILKDCERVKVIISGHTDSRGNPDTNQRLSGLRASSVMNHFIKTGVKKDRLRAVGLGDTTPIAPNDSPENEALNRRIELELY
jgi:outer membrane protein OmpA-like peptidoglycan-associated protein